jgi:small subunit ribosomal protein S2
LIASSIADANAIREAKTLNIPVVALVDTNVNPEGIDFAIPANDDAIKGVQLLLDYVAEAVKEAKTDK